MSLITGPTPAWNAYAPSLPPGVAQSLISSKSWGELDALAQGVMAYQGQPLYNTGTPTYTGKIPDSWYSAAGVPLPGREAVQAGVDTLIGEAVKWATRQAFGSGGGPPPIANPNTMGVGGGVVGGAAGAAIPEIIKAIAGGTNGTGSSCGCRSGGRCGKHEKAPLASFFGGNCPPGRVLRRQPWARDICIKKPRMNPLNPCALRRANRRMSGFARISAGMLKKLGYTVQAKRPLAKIGKKGRR